MVCVLSVLTGNYTIQLAKSYVIIQALRKFTTQ